MALEAAAVRREDTSMAGVRLHVPEGSSPNGAAGSSPDPKRLTELLLDRALSLGCAAAGVFSLESFSEGGRRLSEWVAGGRHGTMGYLAEGDRCSPTQLLPAGRAGLVVAVPYAVGGPAGRLRARGGAPVASEAPSAVAPQERGSVAPPATAPRAPATGEVPLRTIPGGTDTGALRGKVAKYAQGDDYHHQLRMLLMELADLCALEVGGPVSARVCVDTAPLLERDAAERAGLSFFGKNTLAIVPGVGSYFLLGELLVDATLAPGVVVRGRRRREVPREGCGGCTACLDACPTSAFLGAHAIDARRCISYLTIEYEGVIPEELRPGIGAHVFGCDICQDVCPFNQSAYKRDGGSPLGHHPRLDEPDLLELLELTSSGYRRFVAGTALRRVNRARLARNAAVALGNVGDQRALLPLTRALSEHPSALVRGHAAWALGKVLQRVVLDGSARAGRSVSDARSAEETYTDGSTPAAAEAFMTARRALDEAARRDPEAWVQDEARRAYVGAQGDRAGRRLPLLR